MGISGSRKGVLRMKSGVAARREWGVLPRNSAVFGRREGAARRFSARRTVPGAQGEKILKTFKKRGENPEIGVR